MATEMSGVCSATFFAAFVEHPAIAKKAARATTHCRNARRLALQKEFPSIRRPATKLCLNERICTRETEIAWLRWRRFMSLMPFPQLDSPRRAWRSDREKTLH